MGTVKIDDWKMLCTRNVCNFSVTDLANIPVCLAYSNETVSRYNFALLKQSLQPICPIKANHSSCKASKLSAEEFRGLEPLLHLAVNSCVTLTRNLWIEKGLCNGTMGTVKQIIYKEGE